MIIFERRNSAQACFRRSPTHRPAIFAFVLGLKRNLLRFFCNSIHSPKRILLRRKRERERTSHINWRRNKQRTPYPPPFTPEKARTLFMSNILLQNWLRSKRHSPNPQKKPPKCFGMLQNDFPRFFVIFRDFFAIFAFLKKWLQIDLVCSKTIS